MVALGLLLSLIVVVFAVGVVGVLFFIVVWKFFLIDALLLLFGCRRTAGKQVVATALKTFDVSESDVGTCGSLVSREAGSRALLHL